MMMKQRYSFWVLVLVSTFMFGACDSFKKAQGDKQTNNSGIDPITGKKRKKKKNKSNSETIVNTTLDTIKWTSSPTEKPPITSGTKPSTKTTPPPVISPTPQPNNESPSSELLASYKVAVMLPFMANRFNTANGQVYEKSKLAINTYGGMKMAFDKLEREGVRLEVSVLDTEGSSSKTASLLGRSEVRDAQLIVGPVRNENLKAVANFAKQHQIPLASPISPAKVVQGENPYYLQVSPSLETHCKAITKHIRQQYSPEQVVLICRDKSAERNRLSYFQNANYEYSGSTDVARFKEYVISEISSDYSNIDISSYLHPTQKTVFVIPSWSNESFINTLLRVIRIAKSQHDVVVYGMPKWMDYQKISYDYYEDLNVHISSDMAINPTSPEVQAFRLDYYNRYGEAPREEAFIGYDVMLYMGRMLRQKGTQFQDALEAAPAQYLHTTFQFLPVSSNPNATAENFRIGQYENQYVNILEFKDYYFQKAD